MKAKVQITYMDGSDEIRRFDTLADALDFLTLCEEMFQHQHRTHRGNGHSSPTAIASFEMLP